MPEKTTPKSVPFIVYESMLEKEDRQQRRMVIIIILLILLLVASNALWLYEWNQYDYIETDTEIEVDSEGGGSANYIGRNGDITNGQSNGEDTNENSQA
jgi:hypothetical protein